MGSSEELSPGKLIVTFLRFLSGLYSQQEFFPKCEAAASRMPFSFDCKHCDFTQEFDEIPETINEVLHSHTVMHFPDLSIDDFTVDEYYVEN